MMAAVIIYTVQASITLTFQAPSLTVQAPRLSSHYGMILSHLKTQYMLVIMIQTLPLMTLIMA